MKKVIVSLAFVCAALVAVLACNTPEGKTAANLIAPALACGESVLLTEIGVDNPADIALQCSKFGAIAVSDVVSIAEELLAQLFPPSDASAVTAASPLRAHLLNVIANGKAK